MLTAKQIKEQQDQYRSEETLGCKYLNKIQDQITIHINNNNENYISYYGSFNDFAKTKLIENGFKIEQCKYKSIGVGGNVIVTTGVKISW